MILCLDVGNSHIYGGVFNGDDIILRFRQSSKVATSDEIGIFLSNVLRENKIKKDDIKHITLCSVVPQLDHSIGSACIKYLHKEAFVLQAGVKTGLKINYRNPLEVGADRIANAIAATHLYPEENLVIIDFGTAITFCVITEEKNYKGGVIMPGVRLSMEALQAKTAKLPSVQIVKPEVTVGRSTIESIQSGLYFGVQGACREILQQIKREAFTNKPVKVIGTGGFASLFTESDLFDELAPDLVLQGLKLVLRMNT